MHLREREVIFFPATEDDATAGGTEIEGGGKQGTGHGRPKGKATDAEASRQNLGNQRRKIRLQTLAACPAPSASSSMLNSERSPLTGKRVQLMATCLCDAFYDDVAAATVEILEYLGVEVVFPEAQTCCGQPAFNGGDWAASRKVVRHTVRTFAGEEPVVVPSGSCAAMLFHGAVLEFEKEPDLGEVEALGRRTWELADFPGERARDKNVEWPLRGDGGVSPFVSLARHCER
jgi:hypothetical protein